jgi:hypothetical protein
MTIAVTFSLSPLLPENICSKSINMLSSSPLNLLFLKLLMAVLPIYIINFHPFYDPLVIQPSNITAPYLTIITKHHRDPVHFTASLPFSLKSVYDNLENSEITIFSTTSSSSQFTTDHDTPLPIAAYAHHPSNHHSHNSSRPPRSHNNKNDNNNTSQHPSSQQTISLGIHRTRDGRRFITNNNHQQLSSKPICDLCFNKHVNPWHSTTDCPLRYIMDKDVQSALCSITYFMALSRKILLINKIFLAHSSSRHWSLRHRFGCLYNTS